MKKVFLFLVVLIGVSLFTGCQNRIKTYTEQTSERTTQLKATIRVKEDNQEIANKTVAFKAGDSLYKVMVKNFTIKADAGFIKAINGHEQDPKASKYWTFTVNNELAAKGAKDILLKNGDKVEFVMGK